MYRTIVCHNTKLTEINQQMLGWELDGRTEMRVPVRRKPIYMAEASHIKWTEILKFYL